MESQFVKVDKALEMDGLMDDGWVDGGSAYT